MDTDRNYQSPLAGRYASAEMRFLFSPRCKFTTWRRLWAALAEAQHELGLAAVSAAQVAELRARVDDLDLPAAAAVERETRHDVMAHLRVFAGQCPRAAPILHLGATSCFVTDNTDLIQMREGLALLKGKLLTVIAQLADFAERHRALPALGFTHFQPAQPTTVGKRACLWLYDLLLDFQALEARADALLDRFRGVKGATGTQASFLDLFADHPDPHAQVAALEACVTQKMGFRRAVPIAGQTATRKIDVQVLEVLSGLAESAHKFGTDLRLLAHMKEVEEPFEAGQVGSSAMPYKRNPMRAERLCSLARHLIALAHEARATHALQWLERSLDDSAGRRCYLAESFLLAEALLLLMLNVTDGLVVYPRRIAAHLDAELPFMAVEPILMAAVAAGGDRQALHERLRMHSREAARRVKEEGAPCDLLDRVRGDPAFAAIADRLATLVDPARFVGRAPEQVAEFLAAEIRPLLARHRALLGARAEIDV